jgi:hypothetical protein
MVCEHGNGLVNSSLCQGSVRGSLVVTSMAIIIIKLIVATEELYIVWIKILASFIFKRFKI